MKKQVALIFFCAALASCFAEAKLILTFNPDTNIFTAYKKSAQEVVIFDYPHNKCALFNGTSGSAFIFDFEKRTGVYFSDGSSNKTWYSSQKKFEDYFSKITTLDKLYKLGEKKGVTFDKNSLTAELSKKIGQLLTSLSSEYSNLCDPFLYFIEMCKTNGKHFQTTLAGLSDVAGKINGEIRGDFKWMVQAFMGYAALFREFKGGMSLLAKKGIKLDFQKILNEPTGIDTLNYFLKEMAPKLDVGQILGKALNSEQHFFQLVNGFGGNMTFGIDGFFNIILAIENYIHGDCSLQDVIALVNAYASNPKTSSDCVKKEWQRAIKDLLDTLEKCKLKESLKNLAKVLKDILGNQWKVGDNNMTKIVQELLKIDPKGDSTAVTNVLGLLGKLKVVKSS